MTEDKNGAYMANEISIRAGVKGAKNGATIELPLVTKARTMAGDAMFQNVQNIGTGGEQLDFGGLTTVGVLALKNLSDTNDVNVSLTSGAASAGAFAILAPGEPLVIPTRQTTVYAKAIGGASNVLVSVYPL